MSSGSLGRLLSAAPPSPVEYGCLLVTPWRGTTFARLDRVLTRVPAGAQYLVAARRER